MAHRILLWLDLIGIAEPVQVLAQHYTQVRDLQLAANYLDPNSRPGSR